MKVLSVGNSFSRDAHRYVHEIARHNGENIETYNLYLSDCALDRHYRNMLSGDRAYIYDYNGIETALHTSLEEALSLTSYDVITLQQVSILSNDYDTFEPYLSELIRYIKKYQPKAKIMLHKTWVYRSGCDLLSRVAGYTDNSEMYADINEAYARALEEHPQIYGIIPTSDAIWRAMQLGADKIYRDDQHLSLGFGRYMAALTWYRTFTKKPVLPDTFSSFDSSVNAIERDIANEASAYAVANNRHNNNA
ncbi:MAG: DUF4886 domain-containing protein [Eubacteriales bacterium]|nr:DUF4886 domain-containing protein [Eubacteriales bacterium]